MIDTMALYLSLKLAACTTIILTIICLPLAYWLVTTKGMLQKVIETLALLPLVLPPTVLGFYLLWFTGQQSFLGKSYQAITGYNLPFTFAGILLGSVIFNFPFALRPFIAALESVERKYLEAAWCLGAGSWKTFTQVMLPICWPGILAGICLPFAHTLGEFGVVLILGGNIPGISRTLALVIYDDVQKLDYQAAHQSACFLLLVSLVTILLLQYLATKKVSR